MLSVVFIVVGAVLKSFTKINLSALASDNCSGYDPRKKKKNCSGYEQTRSLRVVLHIFSLI